MRIYKNFKESNNVTLYNGDCRKLLKRLPSESVDLVVTSPPYCIGKAYCRMSAGGTGILPVRVLQSTALSSTTPIF